MYFVSGRTWPILRPFLWTDSQGYQTGEHTYRQKDSNSETYRFWPFH